MITRPGPDPSRTQAAGTSVLRLDFLISEAFLSSHHLV